MVRPNKLVFVLGNPFQSVLEFEGKARANPIGIFIRCFLLGLPANFRLD